MPKKIVIKVSMPCEKDRLKALKIASGFCGVRAVGIGKDNDTVEVVGKNVDSVCLAKCLRKKFCVADIVSVEEVKPPKKEPSPPKCPKKCPSTCCPPPCEPKCPKPCPSTCCPPPCDPKCPKPCPSTSCPPPCYPPPCQSFCDVDSEPNCSVM